MRPFLRRLRADAWRTPSRAVLWRRAHARRALAAGLVVLAAWVVLGLFAPEPGSAGVPVVTVTGDLPAGHRLSAQDLEVVQLPEAAVPAGSVRDEAGAEGQVLGSPVRAGEPLSDLRLHGAGLLHELPADLVMAHVPVADRAVVSVVQPGQRVDVLSSVDGEVVGADLLVLAVSTTEADTPGWGTGGAAAPGGVYLAVTPQEAGHLATASGSGAPGGGVTLALRPPG